MKEMKKIYLVLLLFFLMSCEIFGPENEGVLVSFADSRVVLTNGHGAPVYYIIFGRRAGLEVDWFPGISSDFEIPIGETIEIPLEEIFLGESTNAINVYWWDAQVIDGEKKAGEIRHLILKK